MAKKPAHTPQQAAAVAGVKGFGRIRQFFVRNKELGQGVQEAGSRAAVGGAMAAASVSARNTSKRQQGGVVTQAAVGADKAVRGAHGAISRVNSFVYYGGFIASGLAALSRLPGIGRAFDAAAKVASSPREYMDKTTVSEAVHAPSHVLGGLKKMAEKRGEAGHEGATAFAGKLGDVSAKVAKAESGLTSALAKGAHKVFDPLGDVVEKVGSEKRLKLADKILGRAGKHHNTAVSALEGVLGKGEGEEFAGVRDVVGKAKGLLGDGTKALDSENATAFQETLGSAREKLAELAKGAVDKKTLTGLQKSLKEAEEAGAAFNQKSGMAGKIKDLPQNIKNAPSSFANSNLTNVALKGAVVTATTLQVTSTARGIAEKTHALKQMYCDLTGEKKISTLKLMTSKKVPALVKEARGHVMKEFGPRVVLNFANTIATYGFMKNNSKMTMLVSAGLSGASQLHSAKVQSYGLLPMYEALSQTPEIPQEQYAAFISAASKDAAKAGGMESQLVQALAVDYAREGVRPLDILKEVESGRFDERAVEKVEENRAAMEKTGGHALATAEAGNAPVLGEHTQRLQTTNGIQHGNAQLRG